MADPTQQSAQQDTASPPAESASSGSHILVPGLPVPEAPSEGALAFFKPDAIPYALILGVCAYGFVKLARTLGDRIAERIVAQRLVIKQSVTLLGFGVYGLTGVLVITALFELSAQAIFALSGTLAVAGGFLLKDVAEATVAGISILVSRPFQVGDRIQFGDYYGEVLDIGLRSVRLVTLDDNLVSIPSSKFLSEPVASANAGELDCMVVMPFYVASDADHERARQIVHDAVLSSRFLYLGKAVNVLLAMRLVDEIGVVIEITAKAYVFDARHEKNFASDVTDRVLRGFRASQVRLPAQAA